MYTFKLQMNFSCFKFHFSFIGVKDGKGKFLNRFCQSADCRLVVKKRVSSALSHCPKISAMKKLVCNYITQFGG